MHIHTQATLYCNLHITEANELSAWNDRLQAHHLICLPTCLNSGTMTVSLTGTASLTMPIKSQLTVWNNTPDEPTVMHMQVQWCMTVSFGDQSAKAEKSWHHVLAPYGLKLVCFKSYQLMGYTLVW